MGGGVGKELNGVLKCRCTALGLGVEGLDVGVYMWNGVEGSSVVG